MRDLKNFKNLFDSRRQWASAKRRIKSHRGKMNILIFRNFDISKYLCVCGLGGRFLFKINKLTNKSMPLSRKQKEEIVTELREKLAKTSSLIFADFTGLSVVKTRDFRKMLRKLGATLKVAKKTLIRRALKNPAADIVVGSESKTPVSVIFGGDIAELSKAVNDFSKTESLKVLGGFLDGRYLAAADIVTLAKLPSRQELLARLARAVQAPLRNLTTVLQGNLRNLVCVLDEIKNKK